MPHAFAPGDIVRARGREWVNLPAPREGWLALRPLSGSEADRVLLKPELELQPVEPARFDLPADAQVTSQANAVLLADALRLTLRRGAGPFRSAAQIAFEPRVYQLVPLLMALRLPVPRLLIADDVGIGKTIEAGLILRELFDRGELDSFSVLCPPHLVEQWTGELSSRFGLEAVAVSIARSWPGTERTPSAWQRRRRAYPRQGPDPGACGFSDTACRQPYRRSHGPLGRLSDVDHHGRSDPAGLCAGNVHWCPP